MTRPDTKETTVSVVPLLWVAVGLALVELGLVLAGGKVAALPSWLAFVRAVVACLALPAAGFPVAIALLGRDSRSTGEPIGAFTLLALSIGSSLLLHYLAALAIRLVAPPFTSHHAALTTVGIAAAALVLKDRFGGLRVGPEPGLDKWPLVAALAVAVGFAVYAEDRLFVGLERLVPVPDRDFRRIITEEFPNPERVRLEFIDGTHPSSPHRVQVTDRRAAAVISNPDDLPRELRVALVVSARPGTVAELWLAPNARCRIPVPRAPSGRSRWAGIPARGHHRRLASVVTPRDVLGMPLTPLLSWSNALLLHRTRLPPGPSCLELRFHPDPRPGPFPPIEAIKWPAKMRGPGPPDILLTDLSDRDLGNLDLFGKDLVLMAAGATECHVSDATYREQMRGSNEISPHQLLWGYWVQFVVEQLAGSRDPARGVLFLFLSLLCFSGALVLLGSTRVTPREDGTARVESVSTHPNKVATPIYGLLLLGPFVGQVQSLVFSHNRSFAFPDLAYTFLLVASLCLLIRRVRIGFILLGCLAAYARYPGAFVLAAALLARYLLLAEDRLWTRRTALWAFAAGVVVAAALLVYFSATLGLRPYLDEVYFEVFPEHFASPQNTVLERILAFSVKLAQLSGLTLLLWPWSRHRIGWMLIAVTLAAAIPMMAVTSPHSHYFPPLIYLAAVAGISAVSARRSRSLTVGAGALVAVGTWLSFHVDEVTLLILRG